MTDTTDLVRQVREKAQGSTDAAFWRYVADAIERLSAAGEPLAWAVIDILGDGPALNTTHRKEEADSWREHGGNVIPLCVHPAVPASDRVPVPQNANQAAGMVLVGTAWLQENAPERLRESGPAAPTPLFEAAWEYEWAKYGKPASLSATAAKAIAYGCLTAAPAPDAATVDQIVALAHQMRLACLNWIDLPPGSERGYKSSLYQASIDKLRAAVERVVQDHKAIEEAAGLYAKSLRERAERAEAERDQQRAAIRTAVDALTDCEAERDALLAQLPDGMKHCTILFKECEKGHGRLTATNWIQHGCLVCERDALRAEIDGRRPMSSVEGMVQRARAERAEAINREWTAAADRSRQPAEFYKDYNEGTMRAMQALMSRAEAERDALKAERSSVLHRSFYADDYKAIEAERDALKGLLRECRDGEQCLGVNDALLARIDAALKDAP